MHWFTAGFPPLCSSVYVLPNDTNHRVPLLYARHLPGAVPKAALWKRYPGMFFVGYAAGSSGNSMRIYLSRNQDAGFNAVAAAVAPAVAALCAARKPQQQQKQQQQQQQVVQHVERVVAPPRKGPCRIKGPRLAPAAAAATADDDAKALQLELGGQPAVADDAASPMQFEQQQQQQQQQVLHAPAEDGTACPALAAAAAAATSGVAFRSSSKRKLKLKPPQQLKRHAAAAPGTTGSSTAAAAAVSVPVHVLWEACGHASLQWMVSAAEAAGGAALVPAVLKPELRRFRFPKPQKRRLQDMQKPAAAAAAPGGKVERQQEVPAAGAAAAGRAGVASRLQIAAALRFPAVQLQQLQGADLLDDLAAVNAALLQLAEAMQLPDDVLLLLPALLAKAVAAAAGTGAHEAPRQQQQQVEAVGFGSAGSLHVRLQAWHKKLAAAAAAADRPAVIALVRELSGQLL
jgi:hypothetical protein